MKSEQKIRERIKDLKEIESEALIECDVDCAIRIESIIKNLLWVLEEED